MSDSGTRFAFRLLGELPADANAVLSPASVRLALAMAAEGARGDTERELRDVLGLEDRAAARAELGAVLRRWEALTRPAELPPADASEDPRIRRWKEEEGKRLAVKLSVANRLWASRQSAVRVEYEELLRDAYGAPLAAVDFEASPEGARAEINAWVRERTEGKIPELIRPFHLAPDTRIVLTNAVYLRAAWARPFEPSLTREGDFQLPAGERARVPFMRTIAHFRTASLPEAQVLELPYGVGALAMIVILPDEAHPLSEVASAAAKRLPEWCARLRLTRVDVALPRWKTSGRLDLVESLRSVGVSSAFERERADFSGIDGTRLLFISSVLHEARIEVDEHGTEAAAATAVMAAAAGIARYEPPPVFRADRPFLYAIRDTASGELLFLGRLLDPRPRG
jgi:serpin B